MEQIYHFVSNTSIIIYMYSLSYLSKRLWIELFLNKFKTYIYIVLKLAFMIDPLQIVKSIYAN